MIVDSQQILGDTYLKQIQESEGEKAIKAAIPHEKIVGIIYETKECEHGHKGLALMIIDHKLEGVTRHMRIDSRSLFQNWIEGTMSTLIDREDIPFQEYGEQPYEGGSF